MLVAIAFLLAIWFTGRLGETGRAIYRTVTNLAVYCALAGMVGAKLLMFVFDWKMYADDPSQIFTFSTLQAAGVYQGGLLLALVTAFLYMHRMKMPKLLTADVFAPGLRTRSRHRPAWLLLRPDAAGDSECDRSWAVTFQQSRRT